MDNVIVIQCGLVWLVFQSSHIAQSNNHHFAVVAVWNQVENLSLINSVDVLIPNKIDWSIDRLIQSVETCTPLLTVQCLSTCLLIPNIFSFIVPPIKL